MFRTVPPSIIRSFSLYTQQWYMSYRFADSLRAGSGWNALISLIYSWNETLHVSDSSSVHHQEFFTVHTTMVHVIQVCWQLAGRIRMELLISQIYSCNETLHVSDSSSVHHQEFFTVHTAMVHVIQVCWQLAGRIRMELLISQIYSWNKTLHISDSSSVHYQEYFTVHTAMVYVIQVCPTACEQD
jgi:hypothetical protein